MELEESGTIITGRFNLEDWKGEAYRGIRSNCSNLNTV